MSSLQMYDPQPKDAPVRLPRRMSKRVVPSFIGESGQVLNLLMHRGAGGVVKDYSGEGNHGDIHGAKWADEYSASWALEFDGVDDYVNYPPTNIGEKASYTVAGWFKTDTGENNNWGWGESCNGSAPFFIIYYADTTVSPVPGVRVNYSGVSGPEIDTGTSVADGKWHHVVLVQRASDDRELFIDGSSVATDTTSISTFSVTDGWIGGEASYGQYFNGKIDDVRIYDRALTESEIKAHYEATKVLYGA